MTDFLVEAVASRGDEVAVSDGRRTLTFRDLDREVRACTEELRRLGANPGRTVVVEADLSLESLVMLHAVFRSGALVAPLHPRLSPRERERAIDVLRPSLIVSGDTALRYTEGLGLDEAPRSVQAASPQGPVAVLWTSGTSGRPRGVLLSEAGFRASAEGARRRLDLAPTDVWHASLQPSHVGGLALLLRAAILGSGLEVRGRYSAEELGALLDRGAITHASLVPTMLQQLLEAREGRPAPAGLRALLLGGARTPSDLLARAHDAGYPIALTYGLTEATSQVATAPPELVRRDPGTVGRPLHGVDVRIGSAGQIEVRGPTLAVGVVGGEPLVGEDGWLATDDLGHLDDDGQLRILGRRSDRIISGGVNVDPHEVEAVLRSHAWVDDACVVGMPDETWGERVAALVVVTPSARTWLAETSGPTSSGAREDATQTLLAWSSEELSPAKRPRVWRIVDRLPLNANGKVDRAAAQALLSPGDD